MPSTTVSKLTTEQQVEVLWKAMHQEDFWVYIFTNRDGHEMFQAFECKEDISVGDCKVNLSAPSKTELIEQICGWLVQQRLTE